MIVLNEQRWLIMQPPHTASRCLHRAMCEQYRALWQVGYTPDGEAVDHHTTLLTHGLRDYGKAIVVRDPWDRAIGLWHHLVQFNASHGYGCSDFRDFAAWLRDGDPDDKLSWMYEYTISKWIGDTPFDVVLRYENLADDIRHTIGLDVVLPNTKTHRDPATYYREEATRDAIAQWSAADFRRWYPDRLAPERTT